MKVILKQDVNGLGKIGDIKLVKDGYARNFLIPRGIVLEANDKNMKVVEREKLKVAEKLKSENNDMVEFANKLSSVSITIPVLTGEDDKVFGSVGSSDIVDALKAEGFDIDKKLIVLENPLKALGAFDVLIKVHPEVTAKIKVWVVKKTK